MLEKIHIFHTNDLHSHFDYWVRSQAYIQEQRKMLATKGEASFLIDIGDHLDRSNIYTEATLGKGNVKLLEDAGYDVVTIGNNEGITLSFDELYHLYDDVDFDVVIGNIQAQQGENPAWLKPYTILTTAQGTKIGVIAATAPFELFYHELKWQVMDPRETLMAHALELRPQVDILVCLSHLGLNEDEFLAQDMPMIDVIFGSHTHHILPQGQWVNDVLLTGGGKFGQYTGYLVIEYDKEERKIASLAEELIENGLLISPDSEPTFLYQLSEQGIKALDIPVAQLTKSYSKEWFHHSPLSKLFAEALFDYTKADCVMFNAGIFVEALKKGYVSKLDLHHILPHPINICVVELTGAELREVYNTAQNDEWPQMQLKGLGFRGVIFGEILFYRLRMTKQQELYIGEELVDPKKIYTLATLDLFTFGYFFPVFKHVKKQYYLPQFIRDIFLDFLEKGK